MIVSALPKHQFGTHKSSDASDVLAQLHISMKFSKIVHHALKIQLTILRHPNVSTKNAILAKSIIKKPGSVSKIYLTLQPVHQIPTALRWSHFGIRTLFLAHNVL